MILTDEEIDALWTDAPNAPQKAKRRELVRIGVQAVIAKMAQVAVMPEPAAYAGKTQAGKWKYTTGSIGSAKTWLLYQEREYLAKGLQIVPLYTADQLRTAIAASRLKAMEAAADVVDNADTPDCGGWTASGIADAIRALKGAA